jgi:hypothetical protein
MQWMADSLVGPCLPRVDGRYAVLRVALSLSQARAEGSPQ